MNTTPKPSYSEKLRDPRWQKSRLLIFQRDNWACQRCNSTENTLHVHHKLYIRDKEPWDYPDKLLVTLCEYCHQAETDELPKALDEVRVALQTTWSSVDLSLFAHFFETAAEDASIDASLLSPLIFGLLREPRVRRETIKAYIDCFSPVEPFLSRLNTQLKRDGDALPDAK